MSASQFGSSVGVFAAADDVYVPCAVMALRSFQRWYPEWSYFLAADKVSLSKPSLNMIDRFNIQLLDIDPRYQFVRDERYDSRYPVEIFSYLLVPEILAEKGITHSIGIDGDIFCTRPFDSRLFQTIDGFAGRSDGTLRAALAYRQRKYPGGEVFVRQRIQDLLGIDETQLDNRMEVNGGIVFWKSTAIAKHRLGESARTVFTACEGRVHGDQMLIALTTAYLRLPFTELDESFNFCLNVPKSPDIRRRLKRGDCGDIHIAHFAYAKPWRAPTQPSVVAAHFINLWRGFVLNELGDEAFKHFEDLSRIQVRYPIGPFWNTIRRVRSLLP